MTMTEEQILERQRQIWTNLYGLRASALIDDVRSAMATNPQLSVTDAIRLVDPEREEDYIDFVATRW